MVIENQTLVCLDSPVVGITFGSGRTLQLERSDARALLVIAVFLFLTVGLGGCATELTPRPGGSSPQTAPYVGVFTGEFVDGMPLYRFPTIEVVGSRRLDGVAARRDRTESCATANRCNDQS
jgi:hypothetical protein